MLYMVETGFDDPDNEDRWNAWYSGVKTDELLSIPGFNATQRFRACDDAPVPYLAIHGIDSIELFTSPAYKAGGGGTVGEWDAAMSRASWTRRVFTGIDEFPEVPMDKRLVILDCTPDRAPELAVEVRWLEGLDWDATTNYEGAKALDSSIPQRGFAILAPDQIGDVSGTDGVRAFKPITATKVSA
jgi:hypothetical protein